MRLNKKKLAALAMSAVMAASTMPFPVLAEEFTDGDAANVQDTYAYVWVDHVEFAENGDVTVYYSNGDTATGKATKVPASEASCTEPAKYRWSYTVQGEEYRSDIAYAEGNALGHNYVRQWVEEGAALCEVNGWGHYAKVCTRCKDEIDSEGTVLINPLGHNYELGKTVIDPTSCNNIDPITGQLQDPTKPGSYDLVTPRTCTRCHNDGEPIVKHVTKSATDVTEYAKYVTRWNESGIDSNIVGIYVNGSLDTNFEGYTPEYIQTHADKIVLSDCSKVGTYWITTNDKYGYQIGTPEKVTVAAHHVYNVTWKGKTAEDNKLLKPVRDKDGNQTGVTSNSCIKSANYYEIKTCVHCGNETKTEGVAQPTGEHRTNMTTKNLVESAVNFAKVNGALTATEYEAYLGNLDDAKITKNNTCEADGTVTVAYICLECGKETGETATISVKKLGHEWGDTVKENIVEATCGNDGSYDLVHTCKVCGEKEIVTPGVKVPANGKHSFVVKDGVDETNAFVKFTGTKVVDFAGENLTRKGQTLEKRFYPNDFTVSAEAAITCDTCGKTYNLNTWNNTVAEDLTLTIVDIEKEEKGEAGSITLKAGFVKTLADGKKEKVEDTYTVPYFSSMAAYLDRDTEKDPINGLHKDDDGVWRYYENNEFKKDFTGIAEYQGGKFFVANGVLCSDAKGLNLYNGEWYFLAGGQIQTQVTGLAMYNGEWFFLTNGKLDRSKTGLVEYDGAKFIIAKGELQRYSGLWQDPADGTWYFAALGQIQEQYTGTAIYDGQTFELVNGKLVR